MSSPSTRASWYRLPAEIRLEILQYLLQDGCSLANFATVSREWQKFIEPKNFARITVTRSRLPKFSSMTHRNQGLVRYIWVCLELQEYDCNQCAAGTKRMRLMSELDDALVTTALRDLIMTLSGWEPNGSLLLDISVHSPSDAEHWFKYLTFAPDISVKDCDWKKYMPKPILAKFHDSQHDWMAGSRVSPLNSGIIDASFDGILRNGLPGAFHRSSRLRLPLVPAVTGVILRQQNRRRWSPVTLGDMFSLLPRLQQIHYEPWMEWDCACEKMDIDYQLLFESFASTKLRKLVIFENFTQKYPELSDPDLEYDPIRTPVPCMAKALAKASLQLEILSVSFMVDASHFLCGCECLWEWPNLTSWTLTSRLLAPNESTTKIGDMLRTAAQVAMRMPNLRVMEIWNGQEGLAALFQYKSMGHGQRPVITWRATWDYALQPSVIQAWKAVGIEHQGEHHWNDCVVFKELLNVGDVRCHGDAIHHLKLSSSVIRSVSLHQIRTESQILDGVYEW
ncbi:hypothetical protein CCHR01_11501 [Colletotrichum chrysophilum]|uniref:F-box domain-containing protein n=1 Tax=Colletotrichum chrysophilum TaxID=1836956 RepID=A0AAD9ACZ9_9PEZI|nr:hypothetical protein CCHR01_11501 [Colletotrichum chrysophilum]